MKQSLTMLLFTSVLALSTAFTQLNQIFTWESYKIQLTVPDNFGIVKSTDEAFEMDGDGMKLMMEILEPNITIDELGEAVKTEAKTMDLETVSDTREIEADDLKGYYVEGTLKGNRVLFAGMMDPGSQTNFFISITFDEDQTAKADALRILVSLKQVK